MDELSIILRPRNAGALRRGERDPLLPRRQGEMYSPEGNIVERQNAHGEGMTSRAQCNHAKVEIKRDEGRKRSARTPALERQDQQMSWDN